MNKLVKITLTTVIVASVVGIITTTTSVYATTRSNPTTDDPNRIGSSTSERAQEEGSYFGSHASDPTGEGPSGDQTGRNGLANALTDRGAPQHPSEVIQGVCELDPTASGC